MRAVRLPFASRWGLRCCILRLQDDPPLAQVLIWRKNNTGLPPYCNFPPTDASRAVTQVPIFAPSMMNRARSSGRTPVPTIVMTTPVDADELWISAVNITPTVIRSRGKSIALNTLVKSVSTRGFPKAWLYSRLRPYQAF